jgi:hypothetical protein
MPNFVTTHITTSAHVARQLLDAESHIDFNNIIPEPENIERGGCDGRHEEGEICWYDWRCLEWGTKWNAITDTPVELNSNPVTLRFDTAWAHPFPIIETLAAKNPAETLRVAYADEDLGRNFAVYSIQGSSLEVVVDDDTEDPDQALEIAALIQAGAPTSVCIIDDHGAEQDIDIDLDQIQNTRIRGFLTEVLA